jgi:hypothetical protein
MEDLLSVAKEKKTGYDEREEIRLIQTTLQMKKVVEETRSDLAHKGQRSVLVKKRLNNPEHD